MLQSGKEPDDDDDGDDDNGDNDDDEDENNMDLKYFHTEGRFLI